MELKLKKRELKITLVDGSILVMSYPSKGQHDEYLTAIIEDPSKENELTLKFFCDLGMTKEIFNSIAQPDLYEIGLILTGQKKI